MARVQGAGRVALMVSDFNEKAQALYRSLGYWELGRLPVSYTHLDVYKRQGLAGIHAAQDHNDGRLGGKPASSKTPRARSGLTPVAQQTMDTARATSFWLLAVSYTHLEALRLRRRRFWVPPAACPEIASEAAPPYPCLLYTSRCV